VETLDILVRQQTENAALIFFSFFSFFYLQVETLDILVRQQTENAALMAVRKANK